MNVALCELKSLLVQQSENYWNSLDCGKTIYNLLNLLIKIAEARKIVAGSPGSNLFEESETSIIQRSDNACIAPLQNGNNDNLFSDIDSCEGEVMDTSGNTDEMDEDQNTEENYLTADESYDVSFLNKISGEFQFKFSNYRPTKNFSPTRNRNRFVAIKTVFQCFQPIFQSMRTNQIT